MAVSKTCSIYHYFSGRFQLCLIFFSWNLLHQVFGNPFDVAELSSCLHKSRHFCCFFGTKNSLPRKNSETWLAEKPPRKSVEENGKVCAEFLGTNKNVDTATPLRVVDGVLTPINGLICGYLRFLTPKSKVIIILLVTSRGVSCGSYLNPQNIL